MSMRDKWGLFSTETDPGFRDRLKVTFNGEAIAIRENSIQDASGVLKDIAGSNIAAISFRSSKGAYVSEQLVPSLESVRKQSIGKGKPLVLTVTVTLRGGTQIMVEFGFKPNLTKAERKLATTMKAAAPA